MAWWTRKPKAAAAQLAGELHKIIVAEGTSSDMDKTDLFFLKLPKSEGLEARIKLYRQAALLMVLIIKTQQRRKFEGVLQAYEKIIFPKAADEGATEHLDELKRAMSDFGILRERADPPLTWAREWLAEAGQIEENPVALSAFCIHWLGVISGATEALDSIEPV